ncbi:MAG: ATP-binding protein [Acidobacteriota bacterium]
MLDLNDSVSGILKMLRRLIGEDVDLDWRPAHERCMVRMDPSQIDQILANLAVNARDAITGVGKVTIETGIVVVDEADCADHAELVPGQYVLMAFSDDGCGMDKEILEHLFEPFFTTKEKYKGTGLGLATVYGIVKQNEGFISVASEPGQGTTFRIYLPRHIGDIPEEREQAARRAAKGFGETLLVVEDEVSILKLADRILSGLNYRVLTAQTPSEALRSAAAHAGQLALLVTDVVLPVMNGRELAERMKTLCPEVKCLYMSGYTADIIAHRGVLDKGCRFIQEPFSAQDLAAKVRAALDESD